MNEERKAALNKVATLLRQVAILSTEHRFLVAAMAGSGYVIDMDFPGGYMTGLSGGMNPDAIIYRIPGGNFEGGDW